MDEDDDEFQEPDENIDPADKPIEVTKIEAKKDQTVKAGETSDEDEFM